MRAKPKPLPSADYLRECFAYDPETGSLRWRARPREHIPDARIWASWNARFAGKLAGNIGLRGYQYTRLAGTHHVWHRIIWKMVTGEEPPAIIDHRDNDPANNRWGNFRPATMFEQSWNTGLRKNNTTGYRGVCAKDGKFFARMNAKGVRHHLGTFATAAEASAAYEAAAREFHGEFYRQP